MLQRIKIEIQTFYETINDRTVPVGNWGRATVNPWQLRIVFKPFCVRSNVERLDRLSDNFRRHPRLTILFELIVSKPN